MSITYNDQLQTLQGVGGIQTVGQDLVVRDNPVLTTLADLPASLKSVGAFRGGDVFIEGNPQLQTLSGLEALAIAIYGNVFTTGSTQLPDAQVKALQAKARPFPMSLEVLQRGLPSTVAPPGQLAAGAVQNQTQPSTPTSTGSNASEAQVGAPAVRAQPAAGAVPIFAAGVPAAARAVQPAAAVAPTTPNNAATDGIAPVATVPVSTVTASGR
eukprot:gene3069-3348_t